MANRVIGRGRFGAGGARRPKRVVQWINSADVGFQAVGAGLSVILQTNATLGNTTIVRTRGLMSYHPAVFSADTTPVGAWGIGIVSDQAAVAAASVPGPWTDADWDGWLVWQPFAMRFESITQAGVLIGSVQQVFDSKAMRKVGTNETLVVVAESQASALEIALPHRMLVKLA